MPPLHEVLLLFILAIPCKCADLFYRTIDDQTGDSVTGAVPLYAPADSWKAGPQCLNDSSCPQSQLDPSQCFSQTWHVSTSGSSPRSVTAPFSGTAVYVFGVLDNSLSSTNAATNLIFELDGVQVGSFLHAPTGSAGYQYNTILYANDSIADGEHTIVILTSSVDDSLFIFDHINYTFVNDHVPSGATVQSSIPSSTSSGTVPATSPQSTIITSAFSMTTLPLSPPSPSAGSPGQPSSTSQNASHHIPVGAVVGGIVGALAILAVAALLLRRSIRRNAAQKVSFY